MTKVIAPGIDEPDAQGWVKEETWQVDPSVYLGDEPTAGDGYETRYWRPDGEEFLVITVLFYVSAEVEGEYGVRSMTTTTHCTDPKDPGSTETRSEVDYDSVDARAFQDPESADKIARERALSDERYALT